jgi:error-prone DNA polymerase
MAEIELKLRAGMIRNGIAGKAQEDIVRSITSFALYGFPESHAASFALIAYASAYLKCHHLAEFTCALLNNQPMGFYAPAILIKDAQRHGLRVLPVDVTCSEWECTVGPQGSGAGGPRGYPACQPFVNRGLAGGSACPTMRLGLRYARGLREEAARAILRARAVRPFSSVDDLAVRVRELRKDELNRLAEIGALNAIEKQYRRDALWQAQRAILPVGPLLAPLEETGEPSPLAPMSTEERLWADYRGTGVTVGKHPMAWRRIEMNALGVVPAMHLASIPNGRIVRIAGSVVVRQRPGTAKGFVFLSMEDETGMMNAIVNPATFEHFKFELLGEPYLIIDGVLQNQDGVVSVKAGRIAALRAGAAPESHDFH